MMSRFCCKKDRLKIIKNMDRLPIRQLKASYMYLSLYDDIWNTCGCLFYFDERSVSGMTDGYEQETFLVQIGNRKEEHFRAVSTPIYFSTAFRHESIGLQDGYDYIRTGNPTRDVLEEAVAKLEKGEKAFATSSGMAALQLVFALFSRDSHFISSRDIYGGNYRLFEIFEKKYNFSFSYWDGEAYETLPNLIRNNTKAI